MRGLPDDRSARLVSWWVRRYTVGLDQPTAAFRCAEIDSDLAEHDRFRRENGWPTSRIGRERVRRLLAGVPGDIGWRHDRLRVRARRGVTSIMMPLTAIAQLLLAAYYVGFVLAGLGLSLVVAAVARPVAPVLANAVTIPSAVLAVMYFWLGVWALGSIVLAGAVTDLAIRSPRSAPT